MESNTSADGDDICGYFEGYTAQRFVIISAFSAVASFGFLANTLLMVVFLRSLPSSAYLAALALMDAFICLSYLLLFGVDAGSVYLKDTTLFFLYHSYIVQVFFIAKTAQFAIPFLLILITLERYLWTSRESHRLAFLPVFSDFGRCRTAIILLIISSILRVPVLFAAEVQEFPSCPDYFRSQSLVNTEWALTSRVFYIFDTHIIIAMQVVFPFLVLLTLNLIIINRLTAQHDDHRAQVCTTLKPRLSNFALAKPMVGHRDVLQENYVLLEVATEVMKQSLIQRSSRDKRVQLRNAIYTMMAIVTSYLICSGVHLFLTFLERTDSSWLYVEGDRNQSSNFYIALSDIVSIFYMVSSAVRILIYCKCNPKLRGEIVAFVSGRASSSISK